MTLAQRLILSLSLLVILATTTLGLFVHQSWQSAEEAQFQSEFSHAASRLTKQLEEELSELPKLLGPLCAHSQMVDDPLTSLRAGGIPSDRRHALSLLSNETRRAYRLDELVLFTSDGEILGSHDPAAVGARDLGLAALTGSATQAELIVQDSVPKVRAHCVKRDGDVGVGLVAARHVGRMLEQVGSLHGLHLGLRPPEGNPHYFHKLAVPALGSLEVYASPKESWLDDAVEQSTRAILLWGALTLAGALVLGWLFARRIAIPMEQLAEQVQQALDGEPKPVEARGSREMVRFGEAFNQAIVDLAQLRKRLAATERIAAQREIARRVAHEIKNPLAPIRAAIETLRRLRRRNDPNFDTYFDEATETVLSEVRRITTIVKEFTEFARMPAPNPTPIDVGQLLHSVVGLHRRDGLDLRVDVDGELPLVHADRDQLVQVVTNLVLNATDAVTDRDAPRVVIAARVVGEVVEVSVSDNGPGVPLALRARLFQPYVTSKTQGTGLGLAIAQKIVTEHGGDIEYAPDKQGGARFVIRMPVSGPTSTSET